MITSGTRQRPMNISITTIGLAIASFIRAASLVVGVEKGVAALLERGYLHLKCDLCQPAAFYSSEVSKMGRKRIANVKTRKM